MIHREMTISDIFSKFPEKGQRLATTMTNFGLHCTSCSAATWETLEAGVLSHGKSEKELSLLIDELNSILKEEVNLETISMTPKAAERFQFFAKEEDSPDACLRFGDSAGGCGGFQYILDFCDKADEDDAVFESEGVTICIKQGMVGRLLGCVIDYVEGMQNGGFKVSNPNVKSSCGCGQSQNY